MKKLILSVFTFLSLICAPVISSAQDVKIGVLYPLTGGDLKELVVVLVEIKLLVSFKKTILECCLVNEVIKV